MGIIGDLKASRLSGSQIAEAVAMTGQLPLFVGGGLTSQTDGRGGTVVGRSDIDVNEDIRPMMVVGGLPAGEDFPDERYWLAPVSSSKGFSNRLVPVGDAGSIERFIPATNLAEWKTGGGTHVIDPGSIVVVFHLYTADHGDFYVFDRGTKSSLLWGTLTANWTPGANIVSLQPCKSATDATSLKQADGVTPVAQVTSVYIQLPTTALTPCFQPLVAGNKPLGYKTEGGISYLVNPQLLPVAQNQFETIVEMSATPATTPHWVNSYPLIHN